MPSLYKALICMYMEKIDIQGNSSQVELHVANSSGTSYQKLVPNLCLNKHPTPQLVKVVFTQKVLEYDN